MNHKFLIPCSPPALSLSACFLPSTPTNCKEQGWGWAYCLPDLESSAQLQEFCYHLLYEMAYVHHLLWRVPLCKVEICMFSGVPDLQLWALKGVRQLYPSFLFSIYYNCKLLLVLIIYPSTNCDTREKVRKPCHIVFVQVSANVQTNMELNQFS